MPSRKSITIYDIAREAHVSPATVSRILTGSTSVRKEKRDAVTALIQKYNFRPNAMARALTETRTKIIGMVCADSRNPYYNSVFTSCEIEAYARGYTMMLLNTFSRPEMEEITLAKLREQRVDAIIICGGRIDLSEPDPAFVQLLDTTLETTPVVVGSKSRNERIYGVAVDHERSMDVALEYLIGLGHRDIGFIYAGTPFYGTQEKLARFRMRMEEAGLPMREEWLVSIPSYDSELGRMGALRLLDGRRQPTALLCINDMVSVGALQGLLERGVRVPQDMSLMGFDDTFITRLTAPQLTAVDYDFGEYARMLVDAAIDAIEGKKPPYNRLVLPTLSVKASCAAPQRRKDASD